MKKSSILILVMLIWIVLFLLIYKGINYLMPTLSSQTPTIKHLTLTPTVISTSTVTLTLTPTLIQTPTLTPTPMPIQLSQIELEKAVWAAPELKGGLEFEENGDSQLYLDVVESFAVTPSLKKYWNNLKVTPTLEGVLAYLRTHGYFLPGKAGNEELKYLISTKAHSINCSTFSTPNLQRGIYLDGIRVALALPWNWKDPRVKDFLGYSNLRASQNRSTNGWEGSLASEVMGSSSGYGFLVTNDKRLLVTNIRTKDAKDITESPIDVFSVFVSDEYPERVPTIVAGTIYSYLDCFRKVKPGKIYYLATALTGPETCGYDPGDKAPPYFKLSPEGLK